MMKNKTQGNESKDSMYFSEAIKTIDKNIDFNEKSKANTSDYFKDTLSKAENEIDQMMSTSILNNYKRYRNKKYTLRSLRKRKGTIISNKFWWNDKNALKRKQTKRYTNSMNKMKTKINKDEIILYCNEKKDEGKKINLKTINVLPKINSNYFLLNNENKDNFEEKEDNFFSESRRESKSINSKTINNNWNKNEISNTRNLLNLINKKSETIVNSRHNVNMKNYNSTKEIMNNIFKELVVLNSCQEKESKTIERINKYKNKKYKIKKRILKNKNNNKSNNMKKFLVENIKKFNKDKNNKEEKIIREYIQLKLKKDPIVKISEKFAYFNRKPLMTLFNYDVKTKKIINGPLARLKVKDKKIMKGLEKDNKCKDSLIKRLDEDQEKYASGGYFFKNKNNDNNIDNLKKFKNPFILENTSNNYFE